MRRLTKITLFGIRLGVIALVTYWLAIFWGTHWPKPPDIVPEVSDKVKHFGAYFGLGLLLCYVGQSTRLVQRFSQVAAIGIAYGAFDEFTQQFIPGRFADTMDFVADSLGIVSAIAVYAIARHCFRDKTLDTTE